MQNPTDEILWRLYDEQGRPLKGRGAGKNDVYEKGLLHGASHVWIWRRADTGVEVLLQKRATKKWQGRYDISAAGHIDLGEDPVTAAVRETGEETGHRVSEANLKFIGAHHCNDVLPNGWIENELRFLFLLRVTPETEFTADGNEVNHLKWKPINDFKKETASPEPSQYVPHGQTYFQTVIDALENAG